MIVRLKTGSVATSAYEVAPFGRCVSLIIAAHAINVAWHAIPSCYAPAPTDPLCGVTMPRVTEAVRPSVRSSCSRNQDTDLGIGGVKSVPPSRRGLCVGPRRQTPPELWFGKSTRGEDSLGARLTRVEDLNPNQRYPHILVHNPSPDLEFGSVSNRLNQS
ncbi:hypothetical protein GW17_00039680 [Ensete ventricosum]|nr:hypothetical protein GW17_00039680 [Ensete ventricosum]